MKHFFTIAIVSFLSAAAATNVTAQETRFRDLPPAVQRTLNEQAGPAGITSIQRMTRNGVPIYEVRLSEAGKGPLYITQSGSLIRPENIRPENVISSGVASQNTSRKGAFGELPVPVQNTVRGQAGSSRVDDINIVTRNGQTNYTVGFKKDGKPVQLVVDAQGNVLSGAPALVQAQSAVRAPLSAASKATLSELPGAVQETLRSYAQGAQIEDIDKGTLQGRTVYEAAFKHNGQNVELRVAENGAVIRDDVNDRFLTAIGRAPAGSAIAGTASAINYDAGDWRSVPTRTPLSAASKVTFRQLPSAVRNTLRTYSGGVNIEDVDKGTANGQTVYEAAFKHQGENVELRVAEDGTLVKDDVNQRFLTRSRARSAPAAVGRPPSSQVLQGGATGNPKQ